MLFLLFTFTSILTFARPPIVPDVTILEGQELQLPKFMAIDKRPLKTFIEAKKYRLKKKDEQGLVYDTIVNLDHHGFRSTEKSRDAKLHLIFGGCSITFGEGLQDHQTFPYLISQKFKEFNVINFGLRGSGPHDHLYLWQSMHFPEIISQSKGLYIFTIIPDHFARISRTWPYLYWAFPFSTVFTEKDNKLVYKGVNEDEWDYILSQKISQWKLIYWWIRMTNFHSAYLVNSSISRMGKILLELKESYLKQFPEGRFVVTFMRHPILREEEYQKFREELNRLQISLWEPEEGYHTTLESVKNGQWHIPRDGHPSAIANSEFAKFLAMHLKEWTQ
jgi:hypothetical protein